ncbi:MAG: hypothetical protein QNJ60_01335 [Xenococcaceae cyanobacterium MO_188.B19]|nr:hypothetical protein [Xenococcaceae cyanobacterium MO_188.B19]
MINNNQNQEILLTDSDQKELEKKLKEIEIMNLDCEEKAIKSSLLYLDYGLVQQATKVINTSKLSESKNYKIHLILGDLLSIQKHYSLAIKSYEKAKQAADNSNDSNSQEISIIAQIELANCFLYKSKQELEKSSEIGERLKELISEHPILLASGPGGCRNECKVFNIFPGEYRWLYLMRICFPCN